MQDPTQPLFHWYLDCLYGKELVFALYTRPCRYGRCTFCSLPSLAEGGEAVTARHIDQQVDYILSQYTSEELEQVAKVSVYTASSTLDQACLPTRSMMYLMLKICDFPHLEVVSLETRPEYVEDWELKALRNVLGKKVKLEIAIGYETHDPHLRNKVLGKGLSEKSLRRLMEMLAVNHNHLKAYVMLKPHHSLNEEGAVIEAINGLQHLKELGEEFKVPVSIHLNPTYMAEDCSLSNEMKLNNYQPPELTSVMSVIKAAEERKLPVFIGLDDEGLAVEGGVFRSTGLNRKKTVQALIDYNRHQDFDRLIAEVG